MCARRDPSEKTMQCNGGWVVGSYVRVDVGVDVDWGYVALVMKC